VVGRLTVDAHVSRIDPFPGVRLGHAVHGDAAGLDPFTHPAPRAISKAGENLVKAAHSGPNLGIFTALNQQGGAVSRLMGQE
jgi:hypothetical protein